MRNGPDASDTRGMTNMKRFRGLPVVVALAVGACGGATGSGEVPTGAEAEAIVAELDSLIQVVVDGAARVDAEAVLAPAVGEDSLTLLVGDVLLGGYDEILGQFRESYELLESQEHTVVDKQIRFLGPDVALALVTAWGTYTDDAGWVSDPVGIGVTFVFVRRGDRWRLTHAHQSFIE